eukprot:352498-Chlamydomonas_euryale.AAC.9
MLAKRDACKTWSSDAVQSLDVYAWIAAAQQVSASKRHATHVAYLCTYAGFAGQLHGGYLEGHRVDIATHNDRHEAQTAWDAK